MKKKLLVILLTFVLLLSMSTPAFALTSQDVTVTATPSFIAISNAPGSFDFGALTENVDEDTGNGYFTVTNSSSVNIDINIQSDNWSGASSWTYGAPAEDTGQLKASSANGGTGGSTGVGAYDIAILSGSDTLLCDNVTSVTNPTWELQIDVASTFTYGDEQANTVTITAVAE